MGILKGILHHWNKTSSAYDTIHPETEVAQVTDWNKGIVNTLASTGLSSLVNVLSSDSLLALLIKKVFDATGVKYSLGQNGYVCLGSLFGGLIIQWGNGSFSYGSTYKDISLPISFPNSSLCVLCSDAISDSATSGQVESLAWNYGASTNSKIRFLANSSSSGYKSLGAFTWIAVCN